MTLEFLFDDDPSLKDIRIGLVEARGVGWTAPSPATFARLVEEHRSKGEAALPPSRKAAVRDMLRHGTYKPAGRAKPSSEYLHQSALEGDFPAVNNLVDAANLVSLLSGYPVSIVDLDKSGRVLLLRRGAKGERYIFNSGGQEIDVTDLLCVCRAVPGGYFPTANPVRDSMATKIFEGVRDVAAVIYAPAGREGQDLESACARLAAFLEPISGDTEWKIAEAGGR